MMADAMMPMGIGPIFMGMDPMEYELVFSINDQVNVVEAHETQQQPEQQQRAPVPLAWYQRPEILALILGVITFMHAVIVQWLWPVAKVTLPPDSPYKNQ